MGLSPLPRIVLWADGECGDHADPEIRGHPLYTQQPVRDLAALGGKPWRPCTWHFRRMWDAQMKLARQVGSGVGVSNGWIEYTGLAQLPADVKAKLLADIGTLFTHQTMIKRLALLGGRTVKMRLDLPLSPS
jgi:hypothetical protein